MEQIRVVTIVFCLLLLLQIVRSVRREHIRVEYSMAWFGVAVLLLSLCLSKTALNWLSRIFGIYDSPLVLLVVAGVLFLFIFYRSSIQVSGLKDHNIVLAQKIGLLEWELKRQGVQLAQLREQKGGESVQIHREWRNVHILYDGTPLLMRSAGVKNYHYSLLKNLIPSISPHRLSLFPFLRTLAPNRNDRSNYARLRTSWRLGAVLGSNYLGFPLADFGARRADLFHATQHVWKLPGGKCLTSMVHDATPLTLPECHTKSNIRYFQAFVGDTLHRLHRILVPSNAVKTYLVEELRVPESKISVVYHGVEERFFESSASAHFLVRRKYNLPDKYVLFVGTLEPRKNIVRLVEAYSSMPRGLRREHPLVLVGSLGWKSGEIKRALAKAPEVVVLGHVKRALLPQIYHGASLFAFPTLYEGFGLPLLEAMAAGLPIVTSNAGAAPEVAGDSAILVDPLSVAEIGNAMERILGNVQMSSALGGAGRQRARAYTWEKTAAQTKAFFETALGSQRQTYIRSR